MEDKLSFTGTYDDSDSECDEQVIVVPSFPSNHFSGPKVHTASATLMIYTTSPLVHSLAPVKILHRFSSPSTCNHISSSSKMEGHSPHPTTGNFSDSNMFLTLGYYFSSSDKGYFEEIQVWRECSVNPFVPTEMFMTTKETSHNTIFHLSVCLFSYPTEPSSVAQAHNDPDWLNPCKTTPYEAAKSKSKDEPDDAVNVHLYNSIVPYVLTLQGQYYKIFKVSSKANQNFGLCYQGDFSPLCWKAYKISDYSVLMVKGTPNWLDANFWLEDLISWQSLKANSSVCVLFGLRHQKSGLLVGFVSFLVLQAFLLVVILVSTAEPFGVPWLSFWYSCLGEVVPAGLCTQTSPPQDHFIQITRPTPTTPAVQLNKPASKPPRPIPTSPSAQVNQPGPSSDPHVESSSQDNASNPDPIVADAPLGGSFFASPSRSTAAPPEGTTSGGAEDLLTLTSEVFKSPKLSKGRNVILSESDNEEDEEQDVDSLIKLAKAAAIAADASFVPADATQATEFPPSCLHHYDAFVSWTDVLLYYSDYPPYPPQAKEGSLIQKKKKLKTHSASWTLKYVKKFTDDQLKAEFDKIRNAAADLQAQTLRRSLKRPGVDVEQPESKKSKSSAAPQTPVPAASHQSSAGVTPAVYVNDVKHYEVNPLAGTRMLLWGDLHVFFESPTGGSSVEVWNDQQEWVIHKWKLFPFSGVHVLETFTGKILYMFCRAP
ncbi:hypothetical protein Tco_0702489 [Tanacetum coccineum]|uniref:Uncharacterized protein n=1 Tax=Tanacetum coccineum TaxID=301880 RepID=A0ABQ4XY09_9ASTR